MHASVAHICAATSTSMCFRGVRCTCAKLDEDTNKDTNSGKHEDDAVHTLAYGSCTHKMHNTCCILGGWLCACPGPLADTGKCKLSRAQTHLPINMHTHPCTHKPMQQPTWLVDSSCRMLAKVPCVERLLHTQTHQHTNTRAFNRTYTCTNTYLHTHAQTDTRTHTHTHTWFVDSSCRMLANVPWAERLLCTSSAVKGKDSTTRRILRRMT